MSESLGDRINRRMVAVQVSSQEDLAERLGIATSTVNRWITGRAQPRGTSLAKLAGVLDCTPEWLASGEGESRQSQESGTRSSGESGISVVDGWPRLPVAGTVHDVITAHHIEVRKRLLELLEQSRYHQRAIKGALDELGREMTEAAERGVQAEGGMRVEVVRKQKPGRISWSTTAQEMAKSSIECQHCHEATPVVVDLDAWWAGLRAEAGVKESPELVIREE